MKKVDIKLTGNQELELSLAVEKAYVEGWNGKLDSESAPVLIDKFGRDIRYSIRKKLLLGEFISYDNKITSKGIKIAEADYKVRTGTTFAQALKERFKQKKLASDLKTKEDKVFKDSLKGLFLMDKGKKVSLYTFVQDSWHRLDRSQWIELGNQFQKKNK